MTNPATEEIYESNSSHSLGAINRVTIRNGNPAPMMSSKPPMIIIFIDLSIGTFLDGVKDII